MYIRSGDFGVYVFSSSGKAGGLQGRRTNFAVSE